MKDNKYYDGGRYPKPLKKQEQLDLINKYDETKDQGARNKLIEHNIRLVIHIINNHFCNTTVDTQELFELGIIGLIKGIDTFDPRKGTSFATYVSKCITNEVLMCLRKTKSHGIHISLDECINTDDGGNELLLKDVLEDDEILPEDSYINKETYAEIIQIINMLPERDKKIVMMSFGFGSRRYSQKEIAEYLGISQSYVSRKLKANVKIIGEKLKKKMFESKTSYGQSTTFNIKDTNVKSETDLGKFYDYLIQFILNGDIKFMDPKTAKVMYLKYKHGINDNKRIAFLLNVNEKKVNKMLVEGLNALKQSYFQTLDGYINDDTKVDNGSAFVKH